MLELLLSIAAFLITLLLLISVHEYGHFITAKALGVKVLAFSLGFGKAIWRRKSKAGTEYRIAMLPLGGYVKLLDENEMDVPKEQRHLAFNRQPLWVRTSVVVAGPLINVLFAILAIWIVWMIGVERVKPVIGEVIGGSIVAKSGVDSGSIIKAVNQKPVQSWQEAALIITEKLGDKDNLIITTINPKGLEKDYVLPLRNWHIDNLQPDPLRSLGIIPAHLMIPAVIYEIEAGSPAAASALAKNDRIIKIDNVAMSDWMDVANFLQSHPDKKVEIVVEQQGKSKAINLKLGHKSSGFKQSGYLGIQIQPPADLASLMFTTRLSPWPAFKKSLTSTWNLISFNFVIIGKLITGKVSLFTIGGPISIYQTSAMAFSQGFVIFLSFLALLSVMLAVVNILPIPGLDGGHLLFFLIEGVTRRPISAAMQGLILRIGIIFLILLMFQATVNDLMRSFS